MKIAVVFFIFYILGVIAAIAGAIWAIVHFTTKYW